MNCVHVGGGRVTFAFATKTFFIETIPRPILSLGECLATL